MTNPCVVLRPPSLKWVRAPFLSKTSLIPNINSPPKLRLIPNGLYSILILDDIKIYTEQYWDTSHLFLTALFLVKTEANAAASPL